MTAVTERHLVRALLCLAYQNRLSIAAGKSDALLQTGKARRSERGFMSIRPAGSPDLLRVNADRRQTTVEVLQPPAHFFNLGLHGQHCLASGQHLPGPGPWRRGFNAIAAAR